MSLLFGNPTGPFSLINFLLRQYIAHRMCYLFFFFEVHATSRILCSIHVIFPLSDLPTFIETLHSAAAGLNQHRERALQVG